jgi:Holliday junction resolvase RusA-like endonuclease
MTENEADTLVRESEVAIMQFFCPMKPPTATQQMHQVSVVNGKPHFYEPSEVAQARAKLLTAVCRHIPVEPFTGGVALLVKWCFPVTGKHRDGEYRTTKPDLDNLQKMLKDVMTGCGFWTDDALVCREIVEKFWADKPGIFIRVEAIP